MDKTKNKNENNINKSSNIETTIAIKGMTCASCVATIEKEVGKLEGIDKVEINLALETGKLAFNPSKVRLSTIKKVIENSGYKALDITEAEIEKKEKEKQKELKSKFIKLIFSIGFAIPLLLISMGHFIGLKLPAFINPQFSPFNFALAQFLLTLPIVYFGSGFYTRGFKNLYLLHPNMDSLVAIGTSSALIYSIYSLIMITLKNFQYIDKLYFETAGVLLAFIQLGKYLEARSLAKTSDAIKKLMGLKPKYANIVDKNGEIKQILIEDVTKGDIVFVKPGEKIPVDGIIIEGNSFIDESMITGESLPVSKKIDDKVIGGTINKNGTLKIKVTEIGQETVLAHIINLVKDAQSKKAPIAKLADTISLYFVPVVIGIAILSSIIWYLTGNSFTFALNIFVAVLVIACPCALGLATPTAIIVGTGVGAKKGILIKGGEVLQKIGKITTIVFDKTGTLTIGKPEVIDFIFNKNNNLDERELLQIAASLESYSEHPIAQAVTNFAKSKNIELLKVKEFEAIGGKGIMGKIKNHNVVIGNFKLVQPFLNNFNIGTINNDKNVKEKNINNNILNNNILNKDYNSKTKENNLYIESKIFLDSYKDFINQGKSVLFLVIDNKIYSILSIADKPRKESKSVITKLKFMGYKVYMLTGDNEVTAKVIAQNLGIKNVISDVLPDQKSEIISKLKEKGDNVMMIGDGINDAPALALADIGIAVGSATDIAMETADIVLMKNRLTDIINAIKLSKSTMKNIKQNLFWAFIYNIIGIPIAAGILHLFGGPLLNPMIAGAAMAFSSVSVVTNALRLRFIKLIN